MLLVMLLPYSLVSAPSKYFQSFYYNLLVFLIFAIFCRLYDPRVSDLEKMLHKKAFFPSEEFSHPEILELLADLGLQRTLGFTGMLDCAKSVSMLNNSRDMDTVCYGRNLLGLLDALASKLSSRGGEESSNTLMNNVLPFDIPTVGAQVYNPDSSPESESVPSHSINTDSLFGEFDDRMENAFWAELRTISWCPICMNPPFEGIPWLKSDTQVADPNVVRPQSQRWMVSSQMHILEGDFCSSYLSLKLGWTDPPKMEVLSMQLIELSKFHSHVRIHSSEEPFFYDSLRKGILSIYSTLQGYMGNDDFLLLKSKLDDVSWVWIGDNFVKANALAFDSPVKFHPYLYVVPSELVEFKDLLLKLGVRDSFDVDDYLRVLCHLQSDVKGLLLSMDQLNFVVRVLEAISEHFLEKTFPDDASRSTILVPDSYGVLQCARDLVYNDAPWMEVSTLLDKKFVHPSVSNDLASKLGIQSVRSLSLVDEEVTKDIPCMEYSKIKELLAMFGSSNVLLFDLLELADCCKARKVHVIIDKREHPRQTLLQQNLGMSW